MSDEPDRDAVTASLARLRGAARQTLPPACYTSDAMLELETRHVFTGQWLCLGHAEQVARPGDYFTTTLRDEPLLVVHGEDGRVRALSNVCRHRSNLIASGAGNRRRFVCGYHAWSYGSDGALLHAPFMDGVDGFDRAACALPRFAVETWRGFLFVDLDGGAPALAPRLAAMDEVLADRLDGWRLVHTASELWSTNWKNLMENFLEGYHLSATHPQTLHPVTPTTGCRKFPGGELFTGYRAHYDRSNLPGTPYGQGADPDSKFSVVFGIFPALLVASGPCYAFFLNLRPAGPARVEVEWGALARPGYEALPEAGEYVRLVDRVNQEDRDKLECVQQGQASRHWRPVPLAPDDLEGTIADFHAYVAARVAPG